MTEPTPTPWPKQVPMDRLGVVIVDHGSRRAESNQALERVVEAFVESNTYRIVEPAHMELAEPSIATAFEKCVRRGAEWVIVHPFFLLPGRHWSQDIPRLVAEAAAAHPQVRWLVTAPLANHPLMGRVMDERIRHCVAHAAGLTGPCDVCRDGDGCRFAGASAGP
ncbi:MAG: CbiX/SirB N-terminal domain-containing protein [Phycisphaeraceae bacterium]|nr:CbiX/SirB N-terminal domain-containing protein [Phycisphaeraceae bacterium]